MVDPVKKPSSELHVVCALQSFASILVHLLDRVADVFHIGMHSQYPRGIIVLCGDPIIGGGMHMGAPVIMVMAGDIVLDGDIVVVSTACIPSSCDRTVHIGGEVISGIAVDRRNY